ncbi:MAG: homoserine O-succinyltransferase MetX [Cycloclasticus pugetii]|uniref:Homoserine O-succinyltransferase n=1 Tax=Cycloclasticus pugetii TaxID=34068 RepID=A0AB33Z1H6_9GAMM|nr:MULTISPECIES: homoserine O-acetyltransferase [Cycloclasticus]AFT66084.1 Homoserine O-acetyltransferase [Cycloclasticus sp. P1]ATI02140.1 homoserine O-acetyltransferase [Cycloclasticus sp. PY97N]EPD13108.1 homoserine O-acetyltransferase [Cycloclasticus pugetii]
MSNIKTNSVGIVEPQTLHFDEPLSLESGRLIEQYDIVYETYGRLNSAADNAVLICHALSADHHAAGYHHEGDSKPGWWDICIGPGKAIDTNRFFVVSPCNLGHCSGSTGPRSIDPKTSQAYGQDFPIVTVVDWVNYQKRLADKLGISQWAAVAGGSLGGMQALQWAIQFPDMIRHAIVIASAPKLSAQNIAFNAVARQAIMSDADFHGGRYYDHNTVPANGLKVARMLGHITYLSDDAMGDKFGRELKNDQLKYDYGVEFQVESYLRYQGESFANRFDANTYLLMTKALDYFDPAEKEGGDLSAVFEKVQAKFFLASFTTDWRFSPARSKEIVSALTEAGRDVSYLEFESNYGHDAFLVHNDDYLDAFGAYMRNIEVSP